MPFLAELKRRNVFRAAAAYVAVAWLVMQVAEVTFPAFGFDDRALRLLIIVLAIGFVPAVAHSWAFEITPEGLKHGEYVLSRDPLCSICAYQLALAYRDGGQVEAAETSMRNFAAATGRGGWHTISMLRLLDDDAEGALATLENIKDIADPWRLHGQAMALHSLGRRPEALAVAAELQRVAAAEAPALLAEVHVWMGDLERAYSWLQKAAVRQPGGNTLPFDWTSPFLRPLLDSPRGQTILRRFGAADEQLAAIPFEVPSPYETSAGIGD